VDAVTGATLGTYGKITVTWNGTNVAGTVVPDGNYNLWIEMGWGSNKTTDHAVSSFTFTKGATQDSRTYTGTVNYSNVQLKWAPLATLAGTTEGFDNVNVFPNPTTGKVTIDFKKEMAKASIKVTDAAGKTLFEQKDTKVQAGTKAIDLSAKPEGIYFINIESGDLKYNYKILIKH
jgi:flagellar hook assembly protein FlgD